MGPIARPGRERHNFIMNAMRPMASSGREQQTFIGNAMSQMACSGKEQGLYPVVVLAGTSCKHLFIFFEILSSG